MKHRALACASLLAVASPSFAHQLDGYLQATTLSLGRNRVWTYVRLTPGVNAFSKVIRGIDADRDGTISPSEQRAYAARVLHDLSFSVDGHPLKLRLLSSRFPEVEAMRRGLGDIALILDASFPRGAPHRILVFENRHERGTGLYLVNLLAPDDPGFRVTAQKRNSEQSRYELRYDQAGPDSSGPPSRRVGR